MVMAVPSTWSPFRLIVTSSRNKKKQQEATHQALHYHLLSYKFNFLSFWNFQLHSSIPHSLLDSMTFITALFKLPKAIQLLPYLPTRDGSVQRMLQRPEKCASIINPCSILSMSKQLRHLRIWSPTICRSCFGPTEAFSHVSISHQGDGWIVIRQQHHEPRYL